MIHSSACKNFPLADKINHSGQVSIHIVVHMNILHVVAMASFVSPGSRLAQVQYISSMEYTVLVHLLRTSVAFLYPSSRTRSLTRGPRSLESEQPLLI